MITDKQFDILAQKAHSLAGLAAVWGTTVLFGTPWYGFGGIIAFATIKEFWYDYKFETPEVRGSSLKDFAAYAVGALVALGAVYARIWFTH